MVIGELNRSERMSHILTQSAAAAVTMRSHAAGDELATFCSRIGCVLIVKASVCNINTHIVDDDCVRGSLVDVAHASHGLGDVRVEDLDTAVRTAREE